MEEKAQLSRFLAEFSIEDVRDAFELKEVADGLNKYLKSRLELLKHKETDMFKYTLQLIELRNQLIEEVKLKSTQVAAETRHLSPLHEPNEGQLLTEYLLDGMYNFDSHVELNDAVERPDFISVQRATDVLCESMPASIPTILFLRDSQGQQAYFVLQYSNKNLALQKLYHFDPSQPATLGESLTEREVTLLIAKIKQFLGDSYLGIKQIVLSEIEKYLTNWEQQHKQPQTPNTFMGRSFMDASSFLYS